MVDVASAGERIETREDLGEGDAAIFQYWATQEAIAEKEERKWIGRARKIVKRYRDERTEAEQKNATQFNILWANVQTLKPTLYGRTPKPDVERRFRDADPRARLASTLLERCLAYSADAFDFDEIMESVVEDRLLPGRGVARVLYVPHFGDEIEPEQDEGKEAVATSNDEFEDREEQGTVIDSPSDQGDEESAREVVWEEAVAKYIFWEDYREGPARKWEEVPWVRYRSYLTREELIKRFGKKKGSLVKLDYAPKGAPGGDKEAPPADIYKKATVHEYWDKAKKQAVWIAPETPDLVLDQLDDPLRLPDFFPNPDPLLSTSTNDKRIPVPDYIEYQDQAMELDRLTARIDRLTRALKVSGVYAGDEKQVLKQLVDEGTENRLIPVGDYGQWADKGGMKGIIEWMPIQQIAETLIQLYNARDKVKAVLYELTGIGDILRGQTEPDETLGAQELKANFATRRITPQQKKVAKFARNLLRLMAAVIAEHFSANTISQITGYPQLDPVPPVPAPPQMPPQLQQAQLQQAQLQQAQQPPPAPMGLPQMNGGQPPAPPDPQLQQMEQQYQAAMQQYQQAVQAAQAVTQANAQKQQQFDAAVQLIKEDGVHGFRIDIEADSTIAPDEQAEKAARVEFMEKFVPFMGQVVPIAQGNQAAATMAEEMTMFVVRAFKVARPLEESISNFFKVLAQMPPPQPKDAGGGQDSPADLAVRSKQVDAQNNKTAATLQLGQQKNALDAAKLAQQAHDSAAELAMKETQTHLEHGLNVAKMQDEAAFRRERAASLQSREAGRLV